MYKKGIKVFKHIGQIREQLIVSKSSHQIKEDAITLNMNAFQMGEKVGICQLTMSGTFSPNFTELKLTL